MNLDLRKFFTREAIAGTLGRLPELRTPVMDRLYPIDVRVSHPLPVVGYEDLGLPQGNIPVVRRGTASYGLKHDGTTMPIIEPQPVNPSVFLGADTINNMAMMTGANQQQLIDNKIEYLRRPCRATAEALSAQSLSGTISYWMKTDGGLVSYTVTFGTPGTVTCSNMWEVSGTKIGQIIKHLGLMVAKLRSQGYGGVVEFWVGIDVFEALIDKIGALTNPAVAIIGPELITLGGGLIVRLMMSSYTNLSTSAAAGAIPAKTVVAVDLAAGHRFFYAALDDLDANLQAMPFFAKPIKVDDPSGYKIVGESKPLPVPNVRGIVTSLVLT